ncbi:hydroxymethylbilane synthase [Akkermansiaceae bacterium]|nr:hydroxymethylbilane synthase [Akkermansiaceae bacterium]
MRKVIIIGTRGSDLALVQATATEGLLRAAFPDVVFRREIISTTGDRRTDVSLADVAKAEGTFDKGVFIKELEEALADGSIDIAVHSLKDMPTVVDARFAMVATLERAPVRDVLLTKTGGGLAGLKPGAKVGTSSVRRAKQIEFLRPDLELLDLRGNVPTRVMKLAEHQDYDAILLAEAGLVRLGFLPEIAPDGDETVNHFPNVHATRLPESDFYPAAGQGAIGLEIRDGDADALAFAKAINHPATWAKATAEREFLRLLDGGCHTPVGVYSYLDGETIRLFARVFPDEGGTPRTGHATGTDPIKTAHELFHTLT